MISNRQQAHSGKMVRAQTVRSAPPRNPLRQEAGSLQIAQQSVGNQGMLRRLEAGLRINDVNDPSEREADRVAQAVMAAPGGEAHSLQVTASRGPVVQRKCAACKEKEEEETLPIQRKESSPAQPAGIPPIVGRVLGSPGRPLDASARAFMEPRFAHNFSQVRIHTDAEAADSARAINARAYAVGNDLVFASNNYSPHTSRGKWVLAHELAHVVQQGRGGAASKFARGNSLERSADQAAVDVLLGNSSVAVDGASAVALARLPSDAEMPILLMQDEDVSKLTTEHRRQLMEMIDKRLQYLDTKAKQDVQPEIKMPGFAGSSPEAERTRLLDWKKKLQAGTGILVAAGIARSSVLPTPVNQSSALPNTPSNVAPAATKVRGTHVTPPGVLAPKPQPRTFEDTITAANADPHKKQDAFVPLQFAPLTPDQLNVYATPPPKSDAKDSNVSRAHTTPPGVAAPKPQSHTLQDTIAAANADPHKKHDAPFIPLQAPPLAPDVLKNAKADLESRQRGEVTLPDGQTILIPPKPSGEFTEDIKSGDFVLGHANVQGIRAAVVRNLNLELRRTEETAQSCRWAAQKFLGDWPIMRRLADFASGAEPPAMTIWLNVDKYIAQSHDAIRQGDLEHAVDLTKSAKAALRAAQWEWWYYKDRNLGGAEDIKSAAEGTRDAAKYTLIALAIVASGGTALVVATAGGIAIDLADVASRAALGEKINWGEVTVEIAIQVVTAKFGGKLTSGLFQAAEKKAAAQGLKLTSKLLSDAVQSVVTGAEARTTAAFIRGLYMAGANDQKPMTWDQFIDQVADPKSVLIDIILGVGRRLLAKPIADTGTGAKDKTTPQTKQSSDKKETTPEPKKISGNGDREETTSRPTANSEERTLGSGSDTTIVVGSDHPEGRIPFQAPDPALHSARSYVDQSGRPMMREFIPGSPANRGPVQGSISRPYNQNEANIVHGAHMQPREHGGPDATRNIVPAPKEVNLGDMSKIEADLRAMKIMDQELYVQVYASYQGTQRMPYDVIYRVFRKHEGEWRLLLEKSISVLH